MLIVRAVLDIRLWGVFWGVFCKDLALLFKGACIRAFYTSDLFSIFESTNMYLKL